MISRYLILIASERSEIVHILVETMVYVRSVVLHIVHPAKLEAAFILFVDVVAHGGSESVLAHVVISVSAWEYALAQSFYLLFFCCYLFRILRILPFSDCFLEKT